MTLLTLKWIAAIAILITSLAAGLATLRIANRYKRFLSLCEAGANGIFLGASLFHLFPTAAMRFSHCKACYPYLHTLVVSLGTFVLLVYLERWLNQNKVALKKHSRAWSMIFILSIHAFITGLALGISQSLTIVSTVFIAIMAHKAFEIFALVITLHRRIHIRYSTRCIFIAFSFITPLGILLGCSGNAFLPLASGSLLTAYFNAIAAGTFFYIATVHAQHRHYPFQDSYHKYTQILAVIAGTALMSILAIWV